LARVSSTRSSVVSRPLSVRIALASVSLLIGVPSAFLAAAGAESLVVLALGLAATLALTVRGLRVSLRADRSLIVVRNYFRTYELRWEDLSHIGVSVTTSIASQFSAVVFRERDGRRFVAAQATTVGGREQRRVIHELAMLRPDLPIQFSE